jgi:hypothetical protein
MLVKTKAKELRAGLAVFLATALLACVFPPGAVADDGGGGGVD